jgi:hypothetical protein
LTLQIGSDESVALIFKGFGSESMCFEALKGQYLAWSDPYSKESGSVKNEGLSRLFFFSGINIPK